MGSCQSRLASNLHEEVPEECFMCCRESTPSIRLTCGHSLHMPCISSWWLQVPSQAMKCPLCLQESDDCIMELDDVSKMPVGFYRKGFIGRMPFNDETKTHFVKISEDGRDMAQTTTMNIWTVLLRSDLVVN